MFNDFIKPVLVLVAICLVVTAAIALVNDATYPIIKAAAEEQALETMQRIISEADVFEPQDIDGFTNIAEAFRALDGDNQLLGYIFVATSNGFGGEMRVMCGIDLDGKIIEVRTLQHSETRGFGDYINHDHPSGFIPSWSGMDSSLEGIDGVTGATVTFRAFSSAVENAFGAFDIIASER